MDKDKVLVDVIEYFNIIKGSPAIFNYFESCFMIFKMKILTTTGLEPTIFRSEVGRHIH